MYMKVIRTFGYLREPQRICKRSQSVDWRTPVKNFINISVFTTIRIILSTAWQVTTIRAMTSSGWRNDSFRYLIYVFLTNFSVFYNSVFTEPETVWTVTIFSELWLSLIVDLTKRLPTGPQCGVYPTKIMQLKGKSHFGPLPSAQLKCPHSNAVTQITGRLAAFWIQIILTSSSHAISPCIYWYVIFKMGSNHLSQDPMILVFVEATALRVVEPCLIGRYDSRYWQLYTK